MALKVPVALQESYEDLVVGFGAGPKGYLYSSSTESGSYSLVTSQTITDGVTGLEYWDASGTTTTWYKHRVGNAAGSSFDIALADAVAVQPGGTAEDYTDLGRWKVERGFGDEVDDAYLWTCIRSITDLFNLHTGAFLGPSSTTTYTFHGRDAVCGGRRKYVPGGMRTLTQVRVKASTGAAWETVTSGDVVLGPTDVRPGQPYLYAEFLDVVTGSWAAFPTGMNDCELTGTRGPSARSPQLVAMSDMILSRMVADRDRGSLSRPTPTKFLYPDDERVLWALGAEHRALVA